MKLTHLIIPILLCLVLAGCGTNIPDISFSAGNEGLVSQEPTVETESPDNRFLQPVSSAEESNEEKTEAAQPAFSSQPVLSSEENETPEIQPSPPEQDPTFTIDPQPVMSEEPVPEAETRTRETEKAVFPEEPQLPATESEQPTTAETERREEPISDVQPETQSETEPPADRIPETLPAETDPPETALETSAESEPEPQPAPSEEPAQVFDIGYWVSFTKDYAAIKGFALNPSATDCWDNPTTANASCLYLERDLKSRIDYYARHAESDDITEIWVWYETVGEGKYLIYIGYA